MANGNVSMVKFYISARTGTYYTGDKESSGDTEVPERPTIFHHWDGAAWILNQQEKDAADAITAQLQQDDTDLAAVKGQNALQNFVKMTPAQVDAYIDTNVTNVPTAVAALKILAKIVLVIARKSMR